MRKHFFKNTISFIILAVMVGVTYPPITTSSLGQDSETKNYASPKNEDVNIESSFFDDEYDQEIFLQENVQEEESIQDYAYRMVTERWGDDHYQYLDWIIKHESQWNHKAQNPHSTAYGLGQFLDSTWKLVGCKKTDDPYIQIDCMLEYIDVIYDNPQKAKSFWVKNRWY